MTVPFDISLAFNVALSLLLIASEALPFIKSNDYNGLLQMLMKKLTAKEEKELVEEADYDDGEH